MRSFAAGPFSLLIASIVAAAPPALDPKIEPRVNDLLSRMTLEEKVGQLIQVSGRGHHTGPEAAKSDPMILAAAGQLGAIGGAGFSGFCFGIIIGGVVCDKIGYGKLVILAFALHVLSALVTRWRSRLCSALSPARAWTSSRAPGRTPTGCPSR